MALLVAAVNLLRTRPRLRAPRGGPTAAGGRLLRRLVGGEVVSSRARSSPPRVLTSLAPPAKAVAELGKPTARVGPGAVARDRREGRLPARAARRRPTAPRSPNRFQITITKDGKPVTGARVTAELRHARHGDGRRRPTSCRETAPGVYEREAPALVMVGHWGLTFDVEPPGGAPFTVTIVDKAGG